MSPPDLTGIVSIAAGYTHSMAIKADGSIVAWGDNASVPPDINADPRPDQFVFNSQSGVTTHTEITSNEIVVSGINVLSPISISGGDYSINGGAFSNNAGMVANGDRVKVRLMSSTSLASTTTATLTIGSVTAPFAITTTPFDTIPDSFTFSSISDVPINSMVVSDVATISGIDGQSSVSISGGEYSINSGGYTSANGSINNGDNVRVRLMSANSFSTIKLSTLTIGGVSANFIATTEAMDTTPNPFSFTDKPVVGMNSVVMSDSIIVSGINSPSPISVSSGEYSINNGGFTSAPGNVTNGDSVRLRVASAVSYSTTTTATLTIGGVSSSFSVTTDSDCTGSPAVRISGAAPRYFSSLQSAYDAATNGDVIQSARGSFTENLNLNRAISVTFDGGYSCDYSAKTGKTTILGRMDITGGTASVGDYNLQ